MNVTHKMASVNVSLKHWVSYVGYSTEGFILIILNGLIMLVILRNKALRRRKESITIVSLALADFLRGLGYQIGGVYRLYLMITSQANLCRTAWQCLLTAHNLVWIFGEPAAAIMLLCVSVDRLIATGLPEFYFAQSLNYSLLLTGSFMSCAVLVGFGVIAVSYMQPEVAAYPAFCFTGWAMGEARWYRDFYQYVQIAAFSCSIVVYILIPPIYYRKKSQILPESLRSYPREVERQKRLLVTMGYSTFFTFLFSATPRAASPIIQAYLGTNGRDDLYTIVASGLGLVENINPMCNFWLYFIRHNDFRQALVCFLRCQEWNPVAARNNSKKKPRIPSIKIESIVRFSKAGRQKDEDPGPSAEARSRAESVVSVDVVLHPNGVSD